MLKNFYPMFIVLLLGSFLVFCGWSAYRAATHGSRIADHDYYTKGLKYNSTLVEKRVARTLGWNLTTALQARQLQIRLTDRSGTPVSGANGKLYFFQEQDRSSAPLPLIEVNPGTYLATLPADLKGEIPVQIDFEHTGAQIHRKLLLNI